MESYKLNSGIMPSPVTFTGLTYSSMIQFLEFAAQVFVHFLVEASDKKPHFHSTTRVRMDRERNNSRFVLSLAKCGDHDFVVVNG